MRYFSAISPLLRKLPSPALLTVVLLATICAWGQAKHSKKAPAKPAAPQASQVGQWASPVYFCTYPCMVASDAAVLNNGNVLFYYYPAKGTENSMAMVLNPVSGALTTVNLPYSEDIFCSGLSIVANGNVVVTGGNAEGGCHSGDSGCGTTQVNLFNPTTSTWSKATAMAWPRWYPSSIEMADGTLLEMSGTNATGSAVEVWLESYNSTTGYWTELPATANLPSAAAQPYPRLTLLSNGNVLLSSPSEMSYQFNPTTNLWSSVAKMKFGYRYYDGHVLLPGTNEIMVAGGSPIADNGNGTATNTAEIIDMSATNPSWSYTGSMTYARFNENLVILADGSVLAVGGGGGGGRYSNPIYAAELYNTTTGTWSVMASQQIQRTYHSTAVLLPDGRVISAGSDNGATTSTSYEIYSPPYLFNGAQPTITASPSIITYGSTFTITTPNASSIASVALVHPGATTHADNFDQRYVPLTFTVSSGSLTATAPANAYLAPPGYYMLVIVNTSGVPSVMPFLSLGS
jgi:hypothetical protein